MSPVNFKLTEPNGITRRVSFSDQPTWKDLASRIELLYGIPIDHVSVSYIDTDNDRVTLSSQDELDDFYAVSCTPGQVIKFFVQDLTSARIQKMVPQISRPTNIRNTFGIPTIDIEDDWQRVPMADFGGLFSLTSNDTQPHAFVESFESDGSTVGNRDHKNAALSSIHSSPSAFAAPLDKGKEKATSCAGISSTGSVLAEDAPPKPPVHVYDVTVRQDNSVFHAPVTSQRLIAESTPKLTSQALSADESNIALEAQGVEDPPLPSFESESQESPSLPSDIAALLNTFSGVISAHPELSEGIRNIVRNAANGTYWQVHREAVSRAAQEIARDAGSTTSSLRRESEEEVGQRVTDALGGVFRTLSQTLSTINAGIEPAIGSMPASEQVSSAIGTNPPESACQNESTTDTFSSFNPNFDSWMHRGPTFGRWAQRLPPPPMFGPPRGPRHGVPAPLPPPMRARSWRDWAPPAPPAPPPPVNHVPNATPNSRPTAQELRTQVDAAKAHYKAQKEMYRLEREERRQERERNDRMGSETGDPFSVREMAAPLPSTRPINPPVVAIQGKDGKPTHEVVSVRRHHTHIGHGARRHGPDPGDLKGRSVTRITKRLADMGFTETGHPDLPSKIQAEVPSNGILGHDTEDNIVTNLLEGLLSMSSHPPVASGSSTRNVPGAWH